MRRSASLSGSYLERCGDAGRADRAGPRRARGRREHARSRRPERRSRDVEKENGHGSQGQQRTRAHSIPGCCATRRATSRTRSSRIVEMTDQVSQGAETQVRSLDGALSGLNEMTASLKETAAQAGSVSTLHREPGLVDQRGGRLDRAGDREADGTLPASFNRRRRRFSRTTRRSSESPRRPSRWRRRRSRSPRRWSRSRPR